MSPNVESLPQQSESEILDLTSQDLKNLSLEIKQSIKPFTSYEDLDLEDYLDDNMKKPDISEIKEFLDPTKIKTLGKGIYQYGDVTIYKVGGLSKFEVTPNTTTYLRKTNRINDLSSPLAPYVSNTLNDSQRFAAFLNYTAYFLNGKRTGTDNIGDVELDNFGSNLIEDNNPFYVSSDILYFNNGGSMKDIAIISQNSLDRMIKGIKLEDLAKFFTNRVKYTFDND